MHYYLNVKLSPINQLLTRLIPVLDYANKRKYFI
jgi:hypothetical protein